MPNDLPPSMNAFAYILLIILPGLFMLSLLFETHDTTIKTSILLNFARIIIIAPVILIWFSEFSLSHDGFIFIKKAIIKDQEIKEKILYPVQKKAKKLIYHKSRF